MCQKPWLPKKKDDAPPEGEKGAKRQKTLKSSKYARDSSTKQPANEGLDYMEQIIMMRENDKPDSFSEADFKYQNKNDIEDLYYLCLNKKVDFRENKLKNSLITRANGIKRVHDFQLGIESYQIRVNLTAPTLTFSGIEAHDPYCIVDRPNTSLIYLNNKEEKIVMYLAEIAKFYDATNKQASKAPCADEKVMMEPDINNMMLNEYLMHKERHGDLARNYTSKKSVSLMRNRFLIYLDSNEKDEEYCSLPPLLLCFHTPQPCTKFNSISHNVENEIDFDSMTLADYDLYMAMQKIGGENLRSMEHEEVPNRCDEETVGDTNHESGNLLNFPTFPVTNEIVSDCIQEEENIIVSTTEGLEEVKVEDVEMDENHNVDHSNTKKVLQCSLVEDPFFVYMEPEGCYSKDMEVCDRVGL
ncbi:hypothetical protein Tco_1300761 [Tanacetum coccineum]